MNIIIPAAGKSQRFNKAGIKLPKCFLLIDGKMMIEHIIEIFDYNDKFYIIFPNEYKKKFYHKINFLIKNYNNVFLFFIKKHNRGPIYSILGNIKLNDFDEVIISYCDFKVDWNYKLFKRQIYGYDGGLPCFKNFHPASFGKTHYAYIRTNKNNILNEIREKKSFTIKRENEPASTGIYYFKSFEIFNYYANKLLKQKKYLKNEAYVSLIYNLMKNDGLKSLITYVEKFICWGTPQDYYQYLNFEKYFRNNKKSKRVFNQTNLIPMGGFGKRFTKEKYNINKPFIPINNIPMVIKSCDSFPKSKNWIFILSDNYLNKYSAKKKLINKFPESKIIIVNKSTKGQAITCLKARNDIDNNKQLFIASCDYETLYSHNKLNKLVSDTTIDGIIWTFKLSNILVKDFKSFAYCRTNRNKKVLEIVEKNIISNNPENDEMVVGSFWFRKPNDFFYAIDDSIKNKNLINGEYYIGNSLNYLIRKKRKKFVTFEIENWISYGNPFELNIYNYWDEYFNQKNINLL